MIVLEGMRAHERTAGWTAFTLLLKGMDLPEPFFMNA